MVEIKLNKKGKKGSSKIWEGGYTGGGRAGGWDGVGAQEKYTHIFSKHQALFRCVFLFLLF